MNYQTPMEQKYLRDKLSVCLSVRLSVSSNSIRTEGLLSLAQAMKVNTTLNHIYIWGNQLEEPVSQVTRTPLNGRTVCLVF